MYAPAMAKDYVDRTFTGPYMGVYGGYGWQDGDIDGAGDVELDGGDYGVYAGFKADTLLDNTVNQLGLGLTGAVEIYYGWSDSDQTIGALSLEKNHEYGISFRPGLSIIDDLSPVDVNPYGILGYKRAEFEATIPGASGDETYDGFELGIGTEVVAYDNVGVRIEYAHTWYGEEDGIDIDEDTVRLGLGYNF
jgi:outer membrane immunogenic protein